MSALARYFRHRGMEVSGYDRTRSEMTDALEKEGIPVGFEDDPEGIPNAFLQAENENRMVIRSLAIDTENRQRSYLEELGVRTETRPHVLGSISKEYDCIAVAGTHGKTTTTCMLTYLLRECGIPSHALLGGISADLASNVFLEGEADKMVVEADEYGRSFLELEPHTAVITAVESDHLDVYGDREGLDEAFEAFQNRIRKDGTLYRGEGVPIAEGLQIPVRSFGTGDGMDVRVLNTRVENGEYRFDLSLDGEEWNGLVSRMPGLHNVIDLAAAIGVVKELGGSEEAVRKALPNFKGVRRRFEIRYEDQDRVLVDDYAHHPTELRAAIRTARELYPRKRITGIFQPHLYSRTRDHADAFAQVLSELDELLLLPVYPAREEPIPGVSSETILDKVKLRDKELVEMERLVPVLEKNDPELLLVLGAGDVSEEVEALAGSMKEMTEKERKK